MDRILGGSVGLVCCWTEGDSVWFVWRSFNFRVLCSGHFKRGSHVADPKPEAKQRQTRSRLQGNMLKALSSTNRNTARRILTHRYIPVYFSRLFVLVLYGLDWMVWNIELRSSRVLRRAPLPLGGHGRCSVWLAVTLIFDKCRAWKVSNWWLYWMQTPRSQGQIRLCCWSENMRIMMLWSQNWLDRNYGTNVFLNMGSFCRLQNCSIPSHQEVGITQKVVDKRVAAEWHGWR